jgi:hypothetical protein
MEWVLRLIDGFVAGAAVMLASILAVMVRMAVLDWLAEPQSRQASTAIGAGPGDLAIAPVIDAPDHRDHPCVPVVRDASVRDILRAHRHAVPLGAAGPESGVKSTDAGVDPLRCEPQDSLLSRTAFIAEANRAHEIRDKPSPHWPIALACAGMAKFGADIVCVLRQKPVALPTPRGQALIASFACLAFPSGLSLTSLLSARVRRSLRVGDPP